MSSIVSDIDPTRTDDRGREAGDRRRRYHAGEATHRQRRVAGGSPAEGRRCLSASRRRLRVAEGICNGWHGLAATVKVSGPQRRSASSRAPRLRPSGSSATSCAQVCGRSLPGQRHTLAHDAER